jgi:hypothetical protein
LKKNILSIILLSLFSCNFRHSNFDKSLLPGYWITLDNSNLGTDKFIVDNDLYMILDSGDDIDSIPFTYKLNNNIITIYKGSHWISKNKIIKLTNDTLIYKRVGDNHVSKYVRKNN